MQIEVSAIPAAVDWLIHGGELAAFGGIAWKVIQRLNRDESLRNDYPPHRHLGGRIVYPREYTPAETERLGHEK